MAISRETKEAQVKQLAEDFDKSKLTVVADYQGLSVADIQQLRANLKEQGSNLRVIKNSLIKQAVKEHKNFKDLNTDLFAGPVALAFGFEDEVAPAQILANFAKDHEALEMTGALSADGEVMSAEQIKHLASLPGKKQLQAQLVATIAAPMSGLVNVLQGNLRAVAQVINAYLQTKAT